MLFWIIVFAAFMVLYTASTFLLKWLKQKKVKINRWVWAFASFLVVIIPFIIWPHMNRFGIAVVVTLCGLFAINFMSEEHAWVSEKNRI